MSIFEEMSSFLQQGRAPKVKELVEAALADGQDAKKILEEGLLSGMSIIGNKFKNNEVYVPEVLIAARAMNAGMEVLKPALASADVTSKGKAILGTVKGDLHDIGKNLVKIMLEGKGIEVIDLGTDVSADQFIQAAIDEGANIIACSALLTTTMGIMKTVVEKAVEMGVRDKVNIMVGGAPVTENFKDTIGADYYTADAASASDVALSILEA
ncbi:MAG: corrinoid protein [Clostridia bacterium]|jgi:corrinoid protein of di/trimethylamine methyltransferase|nr:corrinoid protein [Clostridia bacterium]MBT7121774.1 corrinoid protein [Clostridia bacterium]